MDLYQIWFDLKETGKDVEFSAHLAKYLGRLKADGRIESYRLTRRKLGFGPPELGEFNVTIETRDMAQLDAAFLDVARRERPLEALHAAVWSRVKNFRSGLFRDFPDEVRAR